MTLSVKNEDKIIFNKDTDITWINSHIKAEAIHHRQVTSQINGMSNILNTVSEELQFLDMTKNYVECWVNVFNHFYKNSV